MEEDRISQLSDDILLLILDKIDTCEAIKTSILSKRWKNLRYLLPSLRLRLRLCLRLSGGSFHVKKFISNLRSHCQRVSQFLSHRDAAAAIHDFHLSFDIVNILLCGGIDSEFIEECSLHAINHGVQSLRLHWPTKHTLRLPAAFLTCETLRELEIRNWFGSVKLPGRLSLPNLKTLHLETRLDFDGDDQPFSGLPELEKLTLTNYSWDGLVINAPKLRALEVTRDSLVAKENLEIASDSFSAKEISAPLLTSFRYEDPKAWECAKVDLPMLEQVYLDIYGSNYYNENHTNFLSMIHRLRNATSVSLSLYTIEILLTKVGSLKQTPPPFSNMKCLKEMEGRRRFSQVLQTVMDYLRQTFNCEVKVSPNLSVVEQITNEEEYNYVIKY